MCSCDIDHGRVGFKTEDTLGTDPLAHTAETNPIRLRTPAQRRRPRFSRNHPYFSRLIVAKAKVGENFCGKGIIYRI